MAKLVDALVSGTSVSNYVQVRVLFRALLIFLSSCESVDFREDIFCFVVNLAGFSEIRSYSSNNSGISKLGISISGNGISSSISENRVIPMISFAIFMSSLKLVKSPNYFCNIWGHKESLTSFI